MSRNKTETMPDESYYVVLSRADWRFLLPDQNPKRSIVFVDGILADAVEMISDSIVKGGSNYENDDCDLAVLTDPDHETLKKAWTSLKPGGSIYIEWMLSPFSRLRSVKRRLEAVGFQDATFYMPIPDLENPPSVIWFSLAHANVVRYLLSNNRIDRNSFILKRLSKAFSLFLSLLCPKIFTIFPLLLNSSITKYKVCSVALKQARIDINKATNANMGFRESNNLEINHKIPEIIRSCLNELNICNKVNDISIIMSSEVSRYRKVILLVFAGITYNPIIVIKVARSSESAELLQKEVQVLGAIHEKYEGIEGIPRTLFEGCGSNSYTIAETYVNGGSLTKSITSRNYRELAMKITDWLIELAKNTKSIMPEELKSSCKDRVNSGFLVSYKTALNSTQINQIHNIIGQLQMTYVVCAHNDLGPWNILIDDDGKIGIIDWDAATLNGFQLTDLILVLIWLGFGVEEAYQSKRYRQSYRDMLDKSTIIGRVFNDCLERYTGKLAIPLSDIPAYRLLTLLIQAEMEFPYLAHNEQNPGDAMEKIDNSFYIKLVQEELLYSGK